MESISKILDKTYLPIFKGFLEEFFKKYKKHLLRKPDPFIITNFEELIRYVELLRTDDIGNILKMEKFGLTPVNHLISFLFIYLANSELLTRVVEKDFDYLRILEIMKPNKKPKQDFYFSNLVEIMETVSGFPTIEKYFDRDLRNAIAHFDWRFEFGDPIKAGNTELPNPYISYSNDRDKRLYILHLPFVGQPSLFDVLLGSIAFTKSLIKKLGS